MNMLKSFLPLLATLAVVFSTGCSPRNGERTVRIAYLPLTHAVVLQEMLKQSPVPIELIKYGSWPELIEALNTGRVDAASVLIQPAMHAKERKVPLTVLALGHRNGNVIIFKRDAQTFADLRGQTFAIPHRSSSHYLLLCEALAKEGIDLAELKLVELPPPEMPSALASGRIAGYCVAEPFGAVSVHAGYGRIYRQSDELWPNSVCCALVANQAFLQRDPEVARQLLEAYFLAGERLGDKQLALEDAKIMLKQPEEVLKLSLQWIDYTGLTLTRTAYDELCTKITRYGLSNHPPAYDDFVITGKK